MSESAGTAFCVVPGWISDRDIWFFQQLLAPIRNGVVVEVGLALGRSTAAIGGIVAANNCRHVCVDTFAGGPDMADPINQAYAGGRGRWFRLGFEYNCRALGMWRTIELVEKPSVEAAGDFEDGSIDYCFIDADHSEESVAADLRAWWPKLKPGGLLVGDDYMNPAVAKAARNFAETQSVRLDQTDRGFLLKKPKGSDGQ